MILGFAPRHTPGAGLQKSSASAHDRAAPKAIIALDPRAWEAIDMAVDVDRLPVAFGHGVDLVVDAHVRPLLEVHVPPLPRLHVVVRVGERVDALDVFEVTYVHGFILCLTIGSVDPRRDAHETKFFVVGFEVFDHLRKVIADLFDAWSEDAQRVVVAEADDEHCEASVCGLIAVVAFAIWKGGGDLLHDQIVHHRVVFPTSSDCGGVGCGDDDVRQSGQKSDAAHEDVSKRLGNGPESKPCGDSQLFTEHLKTCQFMGCWKNLCLADILTLCIDPGPL